MLRRPFTILFSLLAALYPQSVQSNTYNWLPSPDSLNTIIQLVKVPDDYDRIVVEKGSFANWLRHLPLKKEQDKIYQYDGNPVTTHNANYAVVEIDIGDSDLLQCADAIIRLRAEFLFSKELHNSISFTFTSGDTADYKKWRDGYRPRVKENRVEWLKMNAVDSSYSSFREYLDSVFMYAGTHSMSRELKKVNSVDSVQIGDAFVLGGFPGHAVLVADMAVNAATGRILLLLIQGFTPAQDIHIIKNESRNDGLPWFEMPPGTTLEILHWIFSEEHLRRF